MGLPSINITFKTLAASAINRGERGIVALLLKDTAGIGTYEITSVTDIPAGLSADNKKQIELALIGGVNAPLRVIVRVGDSATELDWTAGLSWLETVKFNYLAIPDVLSADVASITTWVAAQRANKKMIKVVLPDHAADKEYVINFTTDDIKVGEVTYTPTQYCSRIAGLIAGTPNQISTTYQPLPEVDSVRSYTKTELDTAINNGEFVIFHDGEKVKVARGVTSLVTTSSEKGNTFKKIKLVDILDMLTEDVTKTLSDNYIGKYPNNYDNKVVLLTAIKGYQRGLELDQLLDVGSNAEIDIEAQRAYLLAQGIDTTSMSDEDVKVANTDDQVFIKMTQKVVDAMEDVTINAYI